MAKEILAIPEEILEEVIAVIRAGVSELAYIDISAETQKYLTDWCDSEEEYLNRGKDEK